MAEAIQACERTPGQDTCPFHPGQKITSLCKTCGILVCVECMMSKEHEEHKFKKISECLREPTNAIAKYLTNINKNLLVAVDQELHAVNNERKERVQKHTDHVQSIKDQGATVKREIDSTTNDMVVQMDKHLQEVLDSLDKHTQVLESLRTYLTKEQKECANVLQDGSVILKFDIGNEVIDKADQTKIPKPPNLPDLQHVECKNSKDLIKKALGTLQELHLPRASTTSQCSTEDHQANTASLVHQAPTQTASKQKVAHRYSSFNTLSTWSDKVSQYEDINPITQDTAWAGNGYKPNQQLDLINSTGAPIRQIQTDEEWLSLSVDLSTGQLYGGYTDNTIRKIDTESGSSTVMVKSDIRPDRIKVTNSNDVLVGANELFGKHPVKRYKLTGEVLHTSPEKYNVCDIDQCVRTNRVVLSCGYRGLKILNNNLTNKDSFTGLPGQSRVDCVAVFDSHGNMIVGDFDNKEVYILDGNQYSLIQKVPIEDMSHPGRIKLYNSILWVNCYSSRKVICIEMK